MLKKNLKKQKSSRKTIKESKEEIKTVNNKLLESEKIKINY